MLPGESVAPALTLTLGVGVGVGVGLGLGVPVPTLGPRLVEPAEVVGLLDGDGEADGDAARGVLAGVWLWASVGCHVGSFVADDDAADPDCGGVGFRHGAAGLRCVLSWVLSLTVAPEEGAGPADPVGLAGVGVGVAEGVGVTAGEPVAGCTVGLTVA